jgi:hypothetical protein
MCCSLRRSRIDGGWGFFTAGVSGVASILEGRKPAANSDGMRKIRDFIEPPVG